MLFGQLPGDDQFLRGRVSNNNIDEIKRETFEPEKSLTCLSLVYGQITNRRKAGARSYGSATARSIKLSEATPPLRVPLEVVKKNK